jgi:hypothetical protein
MRAVKIPMVVVFQFLILFLLLFLSQVVEDRK